MGGSDAGQIPGVVEGEANMPEDLADLQLDDERAGDDSDSTEISLQTEEIEKLSRQVEELSPQIELEQRIKLAKQKIEGLERQGAADKDQLVATKQLLALEQQLAARDRFVIDFLQKLNLKDLLGAFKPLKVNEVPVDYPPMVKARQRSSGIRSERSSSKNSESD